MITAGRLSLSSVVRLTTETVNSRMNASRYTQLFRFGVFLGAASLSTGCIGYPARGKVLSTEVAARTGTSSNRLETIEARYTFHRCVMLLTPSGAFQDWIHSVDMDYVLHRADQSKAALTFLRGREWKKILPVPSTNLWVAISQPERRGRQDDLEVVVFQDDDLVRRRKLETMALGADGRYAGFLAFSRVRWVIWYPGQEGQKQYDVLRDRFIAPIEEWGKDEAETLMWVPGDVSPRPPN